MALVDILVRFTLALWNLCVRIVYLPIAFVAFLIQTARLWRVYLVLGVIAGFSFLIPTYIPQLAADAEFGMRCQITPVYQAVPRPIIAGVVQVFFDRFICWFNLICKGVMNFIISKTHTFLQ